MADTNLLSSEEQAVQQPLIQRVDRKSIPSRTVGQGHLRSGYTLVKYGLAANRPTTTTEILLYFATDTFVMSYFDPVSQTWKSGSAFS